MKRALLLFYIFIAPGSQLSYGQVCSGSLSGTTVAPCLGQPFTISTPNFTSFGGSISWEVSADNADPWMPIGTSNFNVNNGAASFTVTPSDAGVRYYRGIRAGNCTFASIMVTVGSSAAPVPPAVTASSYCNGLPTLTASGAGDGTYAWYRLDGVSQLVQVQSGTSEQYVLPALPDGSFFESSFRYYVTFSNGTCTSNASNTLTVLPSGAVPPAPVITAESASVCINQSTTLNATGAGTIKWYGTAPATLLGEGSSIEITPTATRNYFATSTIDGTCTSGNSNQVNVALAFPTAVSSAPGNVDFSAANAMVLTDSDCRIFAKFSSSDPDAELFTKTINAKVSFDNTIKTFDDRPYVQRHYDFHPTEPLSPGYAPFYSITMYFTQAEFDAFNANSSVKLPLNQADAEGYAANLRILHASGTPNSLPATPGNYSAGQVGEDCLACTSVGWSTEYNGWAVTLNTRGFSGFFITAVGATSLPVTLVSFKGKKQENGVSLNWQTTEETNSDRFEIQHSMNGKNWTEIGQVNASGESKILKHYTYIHSNPVAGENLYRMKMIDRDDTYAMSKIVSVKINDAVSDLNVFPNPATNTISATTRVAIAGYQLLAADGTVIRQNAHVDTKNLTLENLGIPAGIYLLKLDFENGDIESRKLVIK